ncbi:c-type cytochrome [Marinobacter sp. M1N3S26]|uniref:c-type cytochrome n=1 Tax=Marinobacter sp. M1N3S26 TaxID=3382299 RepID=UPI00387AA508
MNVGKVVVAGAFMMSVMWAGPVFAAGNPEAGKAKAAVCAACHGRNGVAQIPGYPNLAGQNEAYLISSLKAYRSKERSGGQAAVMQGQASGLSDEDIANLAAYYASLPADGGE